MLFEFFLWWYGPGWLGIWKKPGKWVSDVRHGFSLSVLLGTLFSPWHRIITMPGRSLDEKLKAAVDNLLSRFIGFFVRLGALMAAAVLMAAALIGGLAVAVAWPLIPLLAVYLMLKGFTG